MMDPALLIDTFSADEIEMWNNYNLFALDDNNGLNSLKNINAIKEENIGKLVISNYLMQLLFTFFFFDKDIELDCLSSICPNDLINNFITTSTPTTETIGSSLNINGNGFINFKNENDFYIFNNISDEFYNQQQQQNNNNNTIYNLYNNNNYLNRTNSINSNNSECNSVHDFIDVVSISPKSTSSCKIESESNSLDTSSSTTNIDFLVNNIQSIHNYPLAQKLNLNLQIASNNNNNSGQNSKIVVLNDDQKIQSKKIIFFFVI
jgi:hypothetical protein